MALTLKKKKGLIIPKSPGLILPNSIFGNSLQSDPEEKIIEKAIKLIIKASIQVTNNTSLKRVVFVPIYQIRNGEKEISKIYLSYKTRGIEKVLSAEMIERSGVTILEFFDYIIRNGATEIEDLESALDVM
jgi:hypothetical protein